MGKYYIDMEKVKRMMYEKLWTWAELARQANVTQSTLFALQAGRRNPSLRTIYKIAHALEVEPQQIILR